MSNLSISCFTFTGMKFAKSESFSVKFTCKNYLAWEFQFRTFVTGKDLLGHIYGSDPAPNELSKLAQWKVKDVRVMTWIVGAIDPQIVLNMRSYKTAKSIWEYLKKVYNRENAARHFQQ